MPKEQSVRIILELITGVVISAVLCAVFIFAGYYHFYAAALDQYTVQLVGIPIYEITSDGSSVAGQALNRNMAIISIAFPTICVLAAERIRYFRNQKKK